MKYGQLSLKVKQYWFIKNNKAYLLTYTAEESKYDEYEDVATEMMMSFKFV
jgi:hypothetical protein